MKAFIGISLLALVTACARSGGEDKATPPRAAVAAKQAAASPASSGAAAGDYQAIEVRDAGNIAVIVHYAGEPKLSKSEVARDHTTCGTTTSIPVIEVDKDGQLKNAVVFIEGIDRGKAPELAETARLDNEGCHFLPHVQSVTVGQSMEITNSDPILHNTHAYAGNRTVFNIALPIQGHRTPCKISAAGLMNIRCDAGHGWMNAWIYAFPHPYHAVTDDDGKAVLEDVPPGVHKVTAWHEELGTQTAEVTVAPGATVEVSLNQLVKTEPPAKAST